ncbi:MAG TPA: hypothetical protein VGC44_04590 [Longimicrobiales bacterium]
MMRKLLVTALLLALPAIADAQSLFDTRGLGTPAEGFDARARALGVNGVGLLGLSTSMVNPAEQAGTVRRGVSASFQPWIGTTDFQGENDDISATRFPLVSIVYPTRFATFTLGYSSVLEQSYAVIAEGREILGSDTVPTQDVVEHIGGINQIRFGATRYLSRNFALGVSIGLYTGNLDRGFSRTYPDTTLGFRDFETHTRWNYSAPQASVGFRWDPMSDLRVGGSVTWSGTLKAEPSDSGPALTYEYDMPLRFAVGASGRVGRNLYAAVSGTWVSWSSGDYRTPGSLEATAAEQQMEIGGGLEYQELRSGNRIFPLRLGARTAKLPFHLVGEEAPTEWAITGGIGFRLVEDEFGPLAVADVGVERATREGLSSSAVSEGLKESFWRFTVSLSLFGR